MDRARTATRRAGRMEASGRARGPQHRPAPRPRQGGVTWGARQARGERAECAPRTSGPRAATRQGRPGPEEKHLNEVLTDGKNGLECAARFNERPPGRNLKRTVRTPSRGVDESENRAIMCGSLRRNANGYGVKALRPVSMIFDSVRR